jgi:hypothetical protein
MDFYDGTGTTTRAASSAVSVVPEVRAWHGLTGDLDAGGRLVFGQDWMPLIELGLQWQFLRQGPLHLAIAPAVGGRVQVRLGDSGFSPAQALLPVLATYDLTGEWGVTVGVHAGVRSSLEKAQDPHNITFGDASLRGLGGAIYGAMLGADWHDDRRRAMIGLQWQHLPGHVSMPGDHDYGIQIVQLALTVGWIPGKDALRMDRTDQDLDKLTRPH